MPRATLLLAVASLGVVASLAVVATARAQEAADVGQAESAREPQSVAPESVRDAGAVEEPAEEQAPAQAGTHGEEPPSAEAAAPAVEQAPGQAATPGEEPPSAEAAAPAVEQAPAQAATPREEPPSEEVTAPAEEQAPAQAAAPPGEEFPSAEATAAAAPAVEQAPAQSAPAATRAADLARPLGFAEAGGAAYRLTNGYGRWIDQYVRGAIEVTERDTLTLEATRQDHFDRTGTLFVGAYTRVLDPAWFATVGGGWSDGGFFLPRVRAYAFLSRKWLARGALVTYAGVEYDRARDVHRDYIGRLGAAYHAEGPWVLEVGGSLNLSEPGAVLAPRAFSALTIGRERGSLLTLRVDAGREGYQLVADSVAVTQFASREVSLQLRQWLFRKAGLNVVARYYGGEGYERWGGELGLFWGF